MKKTLLLSALGAIAFSCSQPTEAPAENHEGHDHNHESMAPEEVDEATGLAEVIGHGEGAVTAWY